jgi:hypothetical protein
VKSPIQRGEDENRIEANLGQPGKESDVHVYKIRGEV